MRKSLWVILVTVLITLLLSASTVQAGKLSPQTQMFHQAIAGQSVTTDGNGVLASTTIATQSFTADQDGAVAFTLLQTASISGGASFLYFTITVTLDGQSIYSQTATLGGDIDAIVTSTTPIMAGIHTLAIAYAVRVSPSNPYTITTDPGTVSLLVMTPATSN